MSVSIVAETTSIEWTRADAGYATVGAHDFGHPWHNIQSGAGASPQRISNLGATTQDAERGVIILTDTNDDSAFGSNLLDALTIQDHLGQRPSQPSGDPIIWALLSDRERLVIDGLLNILGREARRRYVYVESVELEKFHDFEDDSDEIVLRQIIPLPAVEALAYWDHLGGMIDQWIATLPRALHDIAVSRIVVDVRWDVDY